MRRKIWTFSVVCTQKVGQHVMCCLPDRGAPPGAILCSKRVITMTWINETSKLLEAEGDGVGIKAGDRFYY